MSIGVVVLTVVHVVLSIAALLLGGVAIARFVRQVPSRAVAFLYVAAAATVTGFLFPFHGITPAILIGLVSSIVLIVTLLVRSRAERRQRGWVQVFVGGVVISEYLLVFVAMAQAFGKIPLLHALAPTLKEAPFVLVQVLVLLTFVVLAVLAWRRQAPAYSGLGG